MPIKLVSLISLRVQVPLPLNQLIEQINAHFPWYTRLHQLWEKLPNCNPTTSSSKPGQSLSEEAQGRLFPSSASRHDDVDRTYEQDSQGPDQDMSFAGDVSSFSFVTICISLT